MIWDLLKYKENTAFIDEYGTVLTYYELGERAKNLVANIP